MNLNSHRPRMARILHATLALLATSLGVLQPHSYSQVIAEGESVATIGTAESGEPLGPPSLVQGGAAPSITGDQIYVTDHRGLMFLVRVQTGRIVQRFAWPKVMLDIALGVDDAPIGISADGELWRMDVATGSATRLMRGLPRMNSLVSATDGTLYGAGDYSLYGIRFDESRYWKVGDYLPYSAAGDLVFDCAGRLLLSAIGPDWAQRLIRLDLEDAHPTLVGTINAAGGSLGHLGVMGLAASSEGLIATDSSLSATDVAHSLLRISPTSAGGEIVSIVDDEIGFMFGAAGVGSPAANAAIQIVQPASAGNAGYTFVELQGSGISGDIATIRLTKNGFKVRDAASTRVLDCSRVAGWLDLTGVEPGQYELELELAGGAVTRIDQPFEVTQGRGPAASVSVIARPRYRAGSPIEISLVVENHGDAAAFGVPVFVSGIPSTATARALTPMRSISAPSQLLQDPFIAGDTDHGKVLLIMASVIPAGKASTFRFELDGVEMGRFELRAWTLHPLWEMSGGENEKLSLPHIRWRQDDLDCIKTIINTMIEVTPFGKYENLVDLAQCLRANFDHGELITSPIDVDEYGGDGVFAHFVAFGESLRDLFLSCADVPENSRLGMFKDFLDGWASASLVKDFFDDCVSLLIPPEPAQTATIEVVTSADPNEKVGPTGAGDRRYIRSTERVAYVIYFENLATAGAAARDVVVSDQLDLSKFDVTSLAFGPVTIGQRQFMPTTDSGSWTALVNPGNPEGWLVRCVAMVDRDSGLVTWSFSTIDPKTGATPADDLAGFLPPNRNAPEGEGSVTLFLTQRSGTLQDETVENQAQIVFDTNPPIATEVWRNRVDVTPPSSAVTASSTVSWLDKFEVRWDGSDFGAGLGGATIFVSVDGEQPTPWRTVNATGAMTYPGTFGHSYGFYSVAFDAVGLEEQRAEQPDVVVTPTLSILSVVDCVEQIRVRGGFTSKKVANWMRVKAGVARQRVGHGKINAAKAVLDVMSARAAALSGKGVVAAEATELRRIIALVRSGL